MSCAIRETRELGEPAAEGDDEPMVGERGKICTRPRCTNSLVHKSYRGCWRRVLSVARRPAFVLGEVSGTSRLPR
eukprot:scaffold114125_cov29-Tisochrysis_lutea.AAC.3